MHKRYIKDKSIYITIDKESWPWPTDVSDRNATHKGDVKRWSFPGFSRRTWCDFIESVYIHLKIIQINTTKTSSKFQISSWFLKESVFQNHSCWISFLETRPSFHGLKKQKESCAGLVFFLCIFTLLGNTISSPSSVLVSRWFSQLPVGGGICYCWWFRNSARLCITPRK